MKTKKIRWWIIILILNIISIILIFPLGFMFSEAIDKNVYNSSEESCFNNYVSLLEDRYSILLADAVLYGIDDYSIFTDKNIHLGIIETDNLDPELLKDKDLYLYNNFDDNFDPEKCHIFTCVLGDNTEICYDMTDIWGYATIEYYYMTDYLNSSYDSYGDVYYDDEYYEDYDYPGLESRQYAILSYINNPLIENSEGLLNDDLILQAYYWINILHTYRWLILSLLLLFSIILISSAVFWFILIIKGLVKFIKFIGTKIPLLPKLVVILSVFTFISSIVIVSFASYCLSFEGTVGIFVIWLLFNLLGIWPLVIYYGWQFKTISKGTQLLASGKLDAHIDTKYFSYELKKHASDINAIAMNTNQAVEERMKSEKLKTELITNVSHDIKTPLTSIINYVDLLSKEKIDSKQAIEYIEILKNQSEKLKTLIINLIDASKASTGNIDINLEKCNAETILTQLSGEYIDSFRNNNIDLVVNLPDNADKAVIFADNKHLFRIFDNLINNMLKYSQENTRAFISLTINKEKRLVDFTFKNTSKIPLNCDDVVFTERFYRGDSSRNTEGNGLGLAIALSLTELMNGNLSIMTDGDLFKATVCFNLYDNDNSDMDIADSDIVDSNVDDTTDTENEQTDSEDINK